MNNQRYIIGIDPDTNKSGIGVFDRATRKLSVMEHDLFDLDQFLTTEFNGDLLVRLEAGHLDNRTWHKGGNGMAKRVGANHEIGRQIEKLLIKRQIPYMLVKPCGLSDYTHESFCKVTGWPPHIKTNPEKRVGGLLCYNY